MALGALRGRGSLADEVFARLMGEILEGRYKSGEFLPPERTLTDVFEVNRHVVREALKRLAQVGMVVASQGGGTRVLDYHQSAGLDLLPWLGKHAPNLHQAMLLWRSVLEMRAALAIDLVRLCAQRASQTTRDDLLRMADLQAARAPTARAEAIHDGEVAFWYRVIDGADSIAFRLAMNGIVGGATVEPSQIHTFTAWEARKAGYRVPLARALVAGDGVTAVSEVERTMREAVEAFRQRIDESFPPQSSSRPTGARRGV